MADSNVVDNQQHQDRHIEIRRDVISSAIVSGDDNKVVIYHYHLNPQVQTEEKPSLSKPRTNPYIGLDSFEVEDADIYFGREEQVKRLWDRLRSLYEQSHHDKLLSRLLPILGPSGSGKSSLAQAGLLSKLAREPLPGHKQTRVLVVKPGDTPLEKLAIILARIATGDPCPVGKTEEFKEVLEKRHEQGTNDGLSFIASMLPEQDYPLVVLVDQFEEIYSSDADPKQRAAFVETLLEASVTRKAQVSVVITLRSDFLGETQQHPKLNQIIGSDQSVFLPVMTRDELRLAIEKPAEKAGHPLDFATVDQLVEQTERREGALPLLQFALKRIWKKLSDSNFTKSSKDILREIGGVGGALAMDAEQIYKSFDTQEKDVAQRVFVGLVQVKDDTRYTRRQVKVIDLLTKKDNLMQIKKVIERFSSYNARLITLSSIDGEEVAEVTHEALFENWKRLRGWLDGQLDQIRQQQRINTLAEEWSKQGKKRGYLLQGRQLDDARIFQRRYRDVLPLSKSAKELIRRSFRKWWVDRLAIVSFTFLPLVTVEGFLREETVKRSYGTLQQDKPLGKREAVLALTSGCSDSQKWSMLPNYIMERLFGNCRSLHDLPLMGSDLRGISLNDADLNGSDISGAELSRSDFSSTSFDRTNLSESSFYNSNLSFASFKEANLAYSNLTNALFRNTNFEEANLQYAILNQEELGNRETIDRQTSDIAELLIERGVITRDEVESATFVNANLEHADLRSLVLPYANFNFASLYGANLQNAWLKNSVFLDADLSETTLLKVDLSNANLTGAKLYGARLNDASLQGANLHKANFTNADLTNANLSNANVQRPYETGMPDASYYNSLLPPEPAVFAGAILVGTSFEGTNITQNQLLEAKLCKTKLPKEISLNPNRDCKELGIAVESPVQ